MAYNRDRWAPGASTLVASTTLRPGVAYKYDTSGGAIAQTLPQASTVRPGDSFWIEFVAGASALTISPFAGDTIDGSSSSTIFQNLGESALFVRDQSSTNWIILGRGLPAFFSQYAVVYQAANQTTNMAVNQHVEFDSIINMRGMPTSLVTVTTGAGQANGIITFTGRRFWVGVLAQGNCNEGELNFNWTTTGGVNINEESGLTNRGAKITDPVTPDNAPNQFWFSIFDAIAAPITMECRFLISTNPVNVNLRAYFAPLA